MNSLENQAMEMLGAINNKNIIPSNGRYADLNLSAAIDSNLAWPEPQPLLAKLQPEAYPVEALPNGIRAAVQEVHGFVKAPLPLVASSALGALSVAGQAYVDVERTSKLTGPVSLFLLTIADSGERKSTCDGFFTKALRDYEQEQAEVMKPEIERYQAEMDSWNAERDGLLSAIKEAAKKDKPTNQLKANLAELQQDKPEPPRIPRILLGDETPENLAWRLAKEWPSAGIVSSEAGSVLGSHGMGKDSIMRNLALYNTLWDGGTHSIGRRTSESFTVKGARLTTALQIQEATLREFNDKSGNLARGTGYFARFMIAWPESTQGTRLFTEPPEHWPNLAAFNSRISEILSTPAPLNAEGCLEPVLLKFTPEAKALWIEFYDSIESMLSSGKELYDVRDVASKSADNAARLAALFHVFTYGVNGSIGTDSFESASSIVAWHLNESRRFFGELALPSGMADAVRLNDWLIQHCKQNCTQFVAKRFVQQYGTVRDGMRLDAAINELESLDRIQIRKDRKKVSIWLNRRIVSKEVA
ncbi:YfjI family protein [Nitrosomonas sp. JL21]|uniref:YfjI family protein n=1 Tax=Nitrosomonas sp. JL21 TaxID=153949 RepID=UPI00136F69D4|nr:YfjI family protein [Nitrosomonas sp. JL21]MBL8497325.1 DUF3987 domain-containing protein [Nitrosomonas sp.]